MSSFPRVVRDESKKSEKSWRTSAGWWTSSYAGRALLKYAAWQVATKLILGIVYLAIISEGLRYVVPPLGQRLYRLPGLSFLQDYEATYRLDLAHFFSLFLLIAVWYSWEKILQLWLVTGSFDDDESGWNHQGRNGLLLTLGIVTALADACLFYIAVTNLGWKGTTFSVSSLVATAAYLSVLLFASFKSVELRKRYADFKALEM